MCRATGKTNPLFFDIQYENMPVLPIVPALRMERLAEYPSDPLAAKTDW